MNSSKGVISKDKVKPSNASITNLAATPNTNK
jgi:hypothetical protein